MKQEPSPEIEAIVREFDDLFSLKDIGDAYFSWFSKDKTENPERFVTLDYSDTIIDFLRSSLHKLATHIIGEIEMRKVNTKAVPFGNEEEAVVWNAAKDEDCAIIKKLIGE